ncbi:MAG: ArnT family glycosyltransferase [Promethearchaeota archaeon]
MQKWVYGLDEAMHLIAPSFLAGSKDPGTKPGYAFILAIIFIILNSQHPFFARLLTVFFASLIPFVGFSFGKKLGGEKIAWITAIFLTFHHRIFDLSYWIMTDVPFTFLSFLSTYFVVCNFQKYEKSEINIHLILITGVLCGLSYLFRQIGIYLILMVILLYFITKGNLEVKFKSFIVFIVGVTIMLFPWFLWSYIQFGVLDPAASVINISSFSVSYVNLLNYIWLILVLIASSVIFLIIYFKQTFIEIKKLLGILVVCSISVLYVFALIYFVFFETKGIFKLILYYFVQIPGLVLGFDLINQYQITSYAIIISIIIFQILLVGLVIGYRMNRLFTKVTLLSIIILLIFLVNIIYYKSRYFYPIIPLLTPFLWIGLFKIKDSLISSLRKFYYKYPNYFRKDFLLPFRRSYSLYLSVMFIAVILFPNIVADSLANDDYLSTDDMVVTSPLWREYIEAALWFKETSDPQAKVMAFKNFDFEYYSQRKCIAPSQQIYSEYFRNNKQAYVTELMIYAKTYNITHIVFGPFGYSDNILFWLSDPDTAPSYVEVIYLRNSPKVIIYLIQWSKFTPASPFD